MRVRRCFLLLIAALPLFAQTSDPTSGAASGSAAESPAPRAAEPSRPSPFRSSVELQFYNFGNFFQVRKGSGLPERSVSAVGAAYRGYWARSNNTPDLYGGASTLRYSGDASETSYTGHVGFAKYGDTHWYDVYVEHTRNGWSFDLEETRAKANITSVWSHYSYPVAEDWRVGAEAYFDWLRFNVDSDLASNYRSLGAVVRYTGFGDLLKPRMGIVRGHRDAEDHTDNVTDTYWYVQVASEPTDQVEVSLRYRARTLDYDNVDRTDDRGTWILRATLKQSDRILWTGSYRLEAAQSSVPNRDFDRNTAYLGMTYKF